MKTENVEQPGEQKSVAVMGRKGIVVQNCVVNVYSGSCVGDNNTPVQTNMHTCPSSEVLLLIFFNENYVKNNSMCIAFGKNLMSN